MVRCVAIIYLLIGSQVFAIDSDYFISYTDNYGYVYDPETGQYVEQEQPPAEHPVVDDISVNSKSELQDRNDQSAPGTGGSSDQGLPVDLIWIVIGSLVLGATG